MVFRVKFKYFGIIIPFLLIFLMSHNTYAVQYNSWLNIQDISRTNLSNDWITHNTANAGSYGVIGSTSLETYRLSASANLSSQVSGGYFSFSGDIYLDIPSQFSGGVVCSAINDAFIVPENVTFSVTSSSLTSCTESNPNVYLHRYTLHVVTNGTISNGSPTSFYFSLGNSSNQTIIGLVGTPDDSPRVFISGDININLSNSPELQELAEINENIVIISQDLQDLSDQITDNTDAIIENQNQNTQDIIRSNQHCHISPNIIYDIKLPTSNIIRYYFKISDLTSNVFTFSTALNVATNSNSVTLYVDNISQGQIGTISGNPNQTLSRTWSFSNAQMTAIQAGSEAFIQIYKSNAGFTMPEWGQMENGSTLTPYEPYGEICKNINEEYYDEQRQADQNISNQSTSDIQGSENQATTNLIGVLSNFFSQLQNFQATDCNLALPFPQFIGGTQTVNICQGKDVLGNFITVIGTLAMVGFYIPLAWVLLKMIYNEIRSFTNG